LTLAKNSYHTEYMRGSADRKLLAPIFLGLLLIVFALSPLKKQTSAAFNFIAYDVGINLNNIASNEYTQWITNQQDDFLAVSNAVFLNKEVGFKDIALNPNTQILGETTNNTVEKWVEVDLSDQRLNMKKGGTTVGTFLVSTGKWYPTPKGEWRIWTKLRYTRMRGGSKALGTFYDLPNVPYTMYYYRGYGIHGAYWHNNFGQPMSHGCVNMKPEEAGIVFNWANVGTRVVVHQ